MGVESVGGIQGQAVIKRERVFVLTSVDARADGSVGMMQSCGKDLRRVTEGPEGARIELRIHPSRLAQSLDGASCQDRRRIANRDEQVYGLMTAVSGKYQPIFPIWVGGFGRTVASFTA